MLYYLLVPLIARMIRGEESRFLSDDIYEGGLTRYLVYPLSFLQYKYVSLLVLVADLGLPAAGVAPGFRPGLRFSLGAAPEPAFPAGSDSGPRSPPRCFISSWPVAWRWSRSGMTASGA